MRLRFPRLAVLGLALAPLLRAGDLPARARTLFDAYLARASRTVTAYRAEIRVGDDPGNSGPGRLTGQSAYLGTFTYRPVTYAELSREERAALVHDPQFRAFLASLDRRASPPPAGPIAPDSAGPLRHLRIPPEEMCRPGPFVIALPP